MPTEACLEEFEALTAIFLDEIEIGEEKSNGETKVSMKLFPATGDDQESKYVTLTLELTLPADYPKVSPLIHFRNPRGLSEDDLESLDRNMKECCGDKLESQMIFELIDMGKEFLTINNRPASECPICLLSFTASDSFFRSQCFHHFHSYCLGRYLENVMQETESGEHLPGDEPGKTCPVCREHLDEDIDFKKMLESPPPFEDSSEVVDGDAALKEWHRQQEKLKRLFDKQKSQGGIIDLSEMDKKRLVISSPRGGGDVDYTTSSSSSDALDNALTLFPPLSVGALGFGGGGGGGAAPVPTSRKNDANKSKAIARDKNSNSASCRPAVSPPQQNNTQQVKQSTPVGAKGGGGGGQPQQPPSQETVQPSKPAAPNPQEEENDPPTERRRNYNHHYRGKGGNFGHGRRRFK